jgi:hypothetical protein
MQFLDRRFTVPRLRIRRIDLFGPFCFRVRVLFPKGFQFFTENFVLRIAFVRFSLISKSSKFPQNFADRFSRARPAKNSVNLQHAEYMAY